tara:strand:- start:3500 stop:3865 length:366 start_codon:yes stop_codon:yes gene_type:complete
MITQIINKKNKRTDEEINRLIENRNEIKKDNFILFIKRYIKKNLKKILIKKDDFDYYNQNHSIDYLRTSNINYLKEDKQIKLIKINKRLKLLKFINLYEIKLNNYEDNFYIGFILKKDVIK